MPQLPFNIFIIIFFLGGWLGAKATAGLRLPGILGMVLFGIAVSAFAADAVPELMWDLAPFLTSVALVVILLRAGLGIRRDTLSRVGLPAGLLGVVPCLIEAVVLTAAFVWLFEFPLLVAALASFVLAAVSPAVVVPSMLDLKHRGFGRHKEVPTLVLAGASLDDVVAITFFTVLLQPAAGLATAGANASSGGQTAGAAGGAGLGASASAGAGEQLGSASEGLSIEGLSVFAQAMARVPLSIAGGLIAGIVVGLLLSWFFRRYYRHVRATEKTLILLMLALLTVEVGELIHVAALLAVMTVGFILLERSEHIAHELALKLSKVWVIAEIVLFVLIGMAVEVDVALGAGLRGPAVIALGLLGRSAGVLVSLALGRARLNPAERLFCVLAYLPKATVQAALGSVPLAAGVYGGEQILAVAVLAILVTAPIGLLSIRLIGPKLLDGPADTAPETVV